MGWSAADYQVGCNRVAGVVYVLVEGGNGPPRTLEVPGVKIGTGTCNGCEATATLYGGTCWDCLMEQTGGNWAEEYLAWEQGEGSEG